MGKYAGGDTSKNAKIPRPLPHVYMYNYPHNQLPPQDTASFGLPFAARGFFGDFVPSSWSGVAVAVGAPPVEGREQASPKRRATLGEAGEAEAVPTATMLRVLKAAVTASSLSAATGENC